MDLETLIWGFRVHGVQRRKRGGRQTRELRQLDGEDEVDKRRRRRRRARVSFLPPEKRPVTAAKRCLIAARLLSHHRSTVRDCVQPP
ncbi:hypothetical protein SESBI_27358 [Sesbania bispinosa]|nr:hypothetical protein SESBI_27358 [Sesbania bispinosa]